MTVINRTNLSDTPISNFSNTNVAASTTTILSSWNNYLRTASSTISSVTNGTLRESFSNNEKNTLQLVTSTGLVVMSGITVSGTKVLASGLLVQNTTKTISIELQGQITIDVNSNDVSGELTKLIYTSQPTGGAPLSYTFNGKIIDTNGFVSGSVNEIVSNIVGTNGISTITSYGLTNAIIGWDFVNSSYKLSSDTRVANYAWVQKSTNTNTTVATLSMEDNPIVSANTVNIFWGLMAGDDIIKISGNGDGFASSGFSGNDLIFGDAGDNYFNNRVESLLNERTGLGNDTIDGGAGYDTVFMGSNKKFSNYSLTKFDPNANSIILIDKSTSDNTGSDKFINIEEIIFSDVSLKFDQLKTFLLHVGGTNGGLFKYGDIIAETINGTAFNDAINGLGGNDLINGGEGNDLIFGGSGNDTADGGLGYDIFGFDGKSSDYTLKFLNGQTYLSHKLGIDGIDLLRNFEVLKFANKSVIIESQPHSSYADLPVGLYQFFITAFNAAPGVTYMNQLAEAHRAGMTVKQIVEVFTTKSQFTDVYPTTLTATQLSQALVNNIVKNSATEATKQAAAKDITNAIELANWTVGQVIFQIFGNLANFSYADPVWGNTAKQFGNQIAVAKMYTDTLSQSTTDLATLRSVMAPVSHQSDVSTPELQITLIGQALLG